MQLWCAPQFAPETHWVQPLTMRSHVCGTPSTEQRVERLAHESVQEAPSLPDSSALSAFGPLSTASGPAASPSGAPASPASPSGPTASASPRESIVRSRESALDDASSGMDDAPSCIELSGQLGRGKQSTST